MKYLLALIAILFISLALTGQQQSLSLPSRVPVSCSAQANNCLFSVHQNTTAIVVARFASFGNITGTLGETWVLDQCVPFTGDCSFHAQFGALTSPVEWDTLSFSGNQFYTVLILVYDGLWTFDAGNYGTYDAQNSAFPDCVNGGSCPYGWTLPVDTESGSLLIAWGDTNQAGSNAVRPGPGYSLEGTNGSLFVEDMIAPVDGVYIGSFIARAYDGAPNGGTHWLMGLAAYKKM